MIFIPPALHKELRTAADARDESLLSNLIKLREIFEENAHRGATRDGIADEAAPSMKRKKATIRRKLWQIRDYPEDKLRYWLDGLSYDHLEWANKHYIDAGFADPAEILDLAAEDGMTVEAMEQTFYPPVVLAPRVQLANWVLDIVARSKKWNWPKSKCEAFEARLREVMAEFAP